MADTITIGIGVTTFNRPKHLTHWLQKFEAYHPEGCKLHIANDNVNRMGVAYRKNECLQNLKDCDYIFLFDDDCYPRREGWEKIFIESGQDHLLYLKETGTIKKIETVYPIVNTIQIDSFNNCGGSLIFLTKKVIEQVGGFYKGYGMYGLEHAGYSERIHNAGLTTVGKYLCPTHAGEYIYAMDYDNYLPINKELNHHSSIAPHAIVNYVNGNIQAYNEDIKEIYRPL